MTTYLIRRILLFFPTLIGATMLVFFVVASAPGGIAAFALSQTGEMRPEERKFKMEYLNKRYGLDKPLMVQYLKWLGKVSPIGPKDVNDGFPSGVKFGLKLPDFGDSFARGRKVGDLIVEAMPITLLLQVVALPIEYVVAILTGIWAAKHRGKAIDLFSGTLTLALWSLPVIWVAVLMIGFLANRNYIGWFPPQGLTDVTADGMRFLPSYVNGVWQRGFMLDFAWHLALPLLCLSYANVAFLHKLTRASLLETIQADFVRTARAKGLAEKAVLYGHAFRNSLIPLITVAATLLPALITGSIVVETVFGINGMGKLTVDGITQRDRELFLSNTLIFVTLGMCGTLLADVFNVLADPRVSYDK